MGKVQDTISRLGGRRKQRAPAEVALIIPSQQKSTTHSFPTSYSAVSSWLDAQENPGPADSGAPLAASLPGNLLRALQHSNRLQNTPAERLRITDLFRARSHRAIPLLNSQYIGMDLPYGTTGQQAFEQASTLLRELSYGYKIALVDALLGRGKLNRKYRIYAIFHAMRAIGECGLRHSQSYCTWPEKSWRDINTLMLLAENDNATDNVVTIDGNTNQSKPNTIRQLYCALAAFSVSNSEHLQALQMDALFSSLCNKADAIKLRLTKPDSSSNIFSVALNSASSPALDDFCRYSDTSEIRFFNLQPIHDVLLASYNREPDQTALSRLQLSKLHHTWCQQTGRRIARSARHKSLSTQTGIKEIASSLKSYSKHDRLDNPFQTDWTLVNESSNGIGLQGKSTESYQVSVGQLIAYRAEQLSTDTCVSQVGVIRWIKHCESDLQIGVETVSDTIQAVLVSKSGNQHAPQLEALLFTDTLQSGDQHMLIVPPQKFKLGEVIDLHTHGSDYVPQMRLAEKLELNAIAECFALKAASKKLSAPRSTNHTIQTVTRQEI